MRQPMYNGSMIIVACSVIAKRDDKVLFIKEVKDVASGKYGLPGGKLELGETLEECAKREFLEETGLEVTLGSLVAMSQKPMSREMNNVVRFIFIANTFHDSSQKDRELELCWLDEAEFTQMSAEGRIRGKDVSDVVSNVFRGEITSLELPKLYSSI